MKKKNLFYTMLTITALVVATLIGSAQAADEQKGVSAEKETPRQVLFTNVNIFNGKDKKLIEGGSVLVEGNLIQVVSGTNIEAPDAYTVDGEGRTLMPGLIDMHSHMCLSSGLSFFRDPYDAQTVGAYTYKTGLDYLQQGFTTTRSAGCNDLGIAKAEKNGILAGPRWYSAGGFHG